MEAGVAAVAAAAARADLGVRWAYNLAHLAFQDLFCFGVGGVG